jgi:NAD(P)H-dependent FMN reductase
VLLGIPGSLRAESSNSALLHALVALAPDRLVLWERLGDLPHFDPGTDGGEPVASLRDAVTAAEAVLVATPEYAGGMPGSLKNALDWLVGTGELYGKRVVVLSAAPSSERGRNARAWVEDVARMQGATVVDSFTVTRDDDAAVVLARVLAGLDGATPH